MKRIVYILLLCSLVEMAYAVMATPEPVLRQLPDGSWAEVYLRGDEHHHYMTTLSGERIAGTEFFWEDDAKVDELRQLAPREVQLDYYVPRTGKVRVPVILVNFTDLSFTMEKPVDQFADFYNGKGGNNPNATGSVRDYYLASSDSLLDLEFDVYGPYTLKHDMTYYGANASGSHMKNSRDLVSEAANLAHEAGVDLSLYDANDDGYIDNLSIVVAGYNEAEGAPENTIWPHYSMVSTPDVYSGKKLRGYLMISEYRGSGGKQQAGIGTYCHEFGHALGLPDLYDTKNSGRYTVGTWDVMCSGSYNNMGCTPPAYSAFERFMMGWQNPIQLEEAGDYSLSPMLESGVAYLIAEEKHNLSALTPSPSEYFLVENRQEIGWDANKGALVGTGLLVSHITFSASAWDRNTFNNSTILGYAIVSASESSPNKSTEWDVFPGKGKVYSWVPTLNDGTELADQQVQSIREMNDQSIRFSYGPLSDDGIYLSRNELPMLVTTYEMGPIDYDTAQVGVCAKNMPNDTLFIYTTNEHFEFSLDSGLTWVRYPNKLSYSLSGDSISKLLLTIRHSPRRKSCDVRTGYVTIESAKSLRLQQLGMSGYAPRPVYIEKPELLEADNISTTSFTAHWVGQEDADYYYLTLFSMRDEKQVDTQGFEDFTDKKGLINAGWSSNFVRTTSAVSESGVAMLFKISGEYLITKEYILSPSSIRFWLSNNYVANVDEKVGGKILLEGKCADGTWKSIATLRVLNTTKNLVKTYTLNSEDAMNQFRFTYTHDGGSGGVMLDGFEAHTDKTIQYVYKGTELEIPATMNSAILNNLQPNTIYYYAVQAYEHKGCEEHYSPLSMLQTITTWSSKDISYALKVKCQENGIYVVTLPEPADGLSDLYIYSLDGQLVEVLDIPYSTKELILPSLLENTMYLLKQINSEIPKKNATGKLVTF